MSQNKEPHSPLHKTKTMSILGTITAKDFLAKYWQKKPLLIRGASNNYAEFLTPDELAGLACEQEIESRLVIQAGDDWKLEEGPFAEALFADLPEKDWTLLVQSVDQWLPEVGAILDEFHFLPSWRLDDVMISYAAEGGGVGPHFDYYDVFLLQTHGRRNWKIGQQSGEFSELRQDIPIRQLKEFQQVEEFDLDVGDMLYIPAGVAHWGTGLDNQCMTWSIGFRAPSAGELINSAIGRLSEQLPEDLRYRDSDKSLLALSGEITSTAIDQFNEISQLLSENSLRQAMTEALGRLSTEPRYPELHEYEDWSEQEVDELFAQHAVLVKNHRCRVAYHVREVDAAVSCLFINGEQIEIPTEFAEAIAGRKADLETFESPLGRELLRVLLYSGVYLVES